MTKHVLRCRNDVITSLNASKHGGRLQISRSDYLWRMWRRIGEWGPFSETNFSFCWWILVTITLPPPRNERQRSVNDFWSWILDNLRALERRYPIINFSAACTGKNASDDIASVSYNWAPTERWQLLWGLSKLHSNELHCIVTELSPTRSVFSVCPCIQLHKYACIVSQIWFFCL